MGTVRRRTAEERLRERALHWPEAMAPATELIVRVLQLHGLVVDSVRPLAAEYGLTLTELEVLVTLRGVVPPHELAPTVLYSAVLISSGGLTKVLRALQGRALITRGSSGADRRSKPVRLTAAGKALAERAMADVQRSHTALIGRGLSDAEVGHLAGLLGKLLATLEPADGAG